MEPECSLPQLQQPTTSPFHELEEISPDLPAYFLKIIFNIIFPSSP